MMRRISHALVTGGHRPFGSAVLARLRADDVVAFDEPGQVPPNTRLDTLVFDLTANGHDLSFDAVTDDDLRLLLDDGLYVLVQTVQAAVPLMAPGSAIVLIVPNAHLGGWGGVHVAASAAACIAMARSMALELASHGIRVNSVAVGMAQDMIDQARADVAATALWLAGSDSGQITGDTMFADRGASLQMAQAARRSPANTRM